MAASHSPTPVPSGRLKANTSTLFVCDLQEKNRVKVKFFPQIVTVANRALRMATSLGIHMVVTELYPKGGGPTVKELGLGGSGIKVYEKTQLSMLTPDVEAVLKKLGPQVSQIILCGVEAHGAILITALNLLEKGYEVHVLADACSSKNLADRKMAYDRMKQSDIFVTTFESAALTLVKDLSHPQYAEIQKILAEPEAASDL